MTDTPPSEPAPAHARRDPRDSPFYVPPFLDALGGFVQRTQACWLWLAQLETLALAEQLQAIPIQMPIFIAGLARSGSTLLHEVVAAHPAVATHRSRDYPMLFTPYWWRRASAGMTPQPPRERPHRDGVLVTLDSPDALEELLWLAFFPRCHDPSVSNVLGAADRHPAFESFYRQHLRKLLLAEAKSRYAAKANSHVARLGYLLRLFPDARLLIPVRHPVDHIASLLWQHRRFSWGQRTHPRALRYMRRTGHFEFGLDRRPPHLGDADAVERIRTAWAAGDEVRGLAILWAMVYGFLGRQLAGCPSLGEAALVVRYEATCAEASSALRAVLDHCGLADADTLAHRQAATIRPARSRHLDFTARELQVIRDETASVASQWGY